MRKLLTLACVVAVALVGSNCVHAQLSYDEAVDGELSDLLGSPTELTLGVGVNTIVGNVGDTGSGATNGSDADYFFFTLGAGESVDSIVASRPTGVTSFSFVGYVFGDMFTGQTEDDLDADALFEDGQSLLPGELLNAPLTEGSHAFWVQETAGAADYGFTFNVVSTAIPEPASSIALFGLGIVGLIKRRR
jgi:hypothetical protein